MLRGARALRGARRVLRGMRARCAPHRYDPAQAHLHLQVAWSGTPPYTHISAVRPHTPHVAPDHAPEHVQPHAALNEPPFAQGA